MECEISSILAVSSELYFVRLWTSSPEPLRKHSEYFLLRSVFVFFYLSFPLPFSLSQSSFFSLYPMPSGQMPSEVLLFFFDNSEKSSERLLNICIIRYLGTENTKHTSNFKHTSSKVMLLEKATYEGNRSTRDKIVMLLV